MDENNMRQETRRKF